MRADELGRNVWTDLVGGLIDARSDPATARFDAELADAVATGALSEGTATRLKFWQRASLRAVTDHARTVLPIALGALDAARRDAQEDVEVAAAMLAAATGVKAAAAEPAEDTVVPQPPEEIDLLRRASTPEPAQPSTLEEDRPRELVAGLVSALEHPTRTT